MILTGVVGNVCRWCSEHDCITPNGAVTMAAREAIVEHEH